MNKIFKSVSVVFTFVLAIGSLAFITSCKGSAEKNETKSEVETDSEWLAELDALGNVFDDAFKACGVSEEDMDDEEMELVDFETVTDDEDGTEIPVAYFRYKGEVFQMMDIDADGTFDIAVFDSNDDDDISDDEIVDITDQNITIDDIAEMAGCETSCNEDECYNDGDEEESIVERTSRDAAPSRQLREEAEEEDLPDYVNNARVKAFRKK